MKKKKTNNLILIPSATIVDREMQLEVGEIPSVLISVSGKPALYYITKIHNKLPGNNTFIILAKEGKEAIKEYLKKMHPNEKIKVIEIDKIKSLGWTILRGLEKINLKKYDNLLINFGDTIVDEPISLQKDIVVYHDARQAFRWTTFQVDKKKRIKKIIDKRLNESTNLSHIFVGIFLIKKIKKFFKILKETKDSVLLDRFYSSLLAYLPQTDYSLKRTKRWYDLGHVDNYYRTKAKFTNARFFNSITINQQKATFKKSSRNVKDFWAEIKWYLKLPKQLQYYVPRVFDYSLNSKSPSIILEYYGYPNLSDIFLFGNYSIGVWNHIFESIFQVLNEMNKFKTKASSTKIREAQKKMYQKKTIDRLKRLEKNSFFKPFFKNETIINSIKYKPLNYYINKLKDKDIIEELLLNKARHVNVIHGDFCLSNLLYDPKNGIIKMVDPRGKFGSFDIYGDQRYDLAKLTHSFVGKYDLIINDLFRMSRDRNKIDYSLHITEKQQKIIQLYQEILNKKYNSHIESIKLIEALLFLSMIPLHSDHKDRQLLILSIGLEKIDKIFKKYGYI